MLALFLGDSLDLVVYRELIGEFVGAGVCPVIGDLNHSRWDVPSCHLVVFFGSSDLELSKKIRCLFPGSLVIVNVVSDDSGELGGCLFDIVVRRSGGGFNLLKSRWDIHTEFMLLRDFVEYVISGTRRRMGLLATGYDIW